jgi:tetrapyrrole methylase family protein/MazG family protein
MGITVVGLGSGDERQLTLGTLQTLENAEHIFVRTNQHPVMDFLKKRGLAWTSFDALYEQSLHFEEVYEKIVEQLLERATSTEVVYAVPGHPSVAEKTVKLLRERCPDRGIHLQIEGGESFLDQAFLRFAFDPVEGFQCVDGTAVHEGLWNPYVHTLICQVYDGIVASDVKLSLMRMYPDDYPLYVGHALGVNGEEQIVQVPLFELDRIKGYGNLSVVWVPKANDERLFNRTFARLREIVEILRSPNGCPWDREQTHQSIRKNLIEETCEVLDALDADEPQEMCEELGDLLLQVMLHAQMEDEVGQFSALDIIQTLNEKLIRRHPHVFGQAHADDAEQALQNWQQIKLEEKRGRGIDVEAQSLLAGLPRELSSLLRALKMQKKASTVGFDWSTYHDIWAKVEEELSEFSVAVDSGEVSNIGDEFGDVLFALVNAARFLRIDPEAALARTNRKFERRFAYIEQQLRVRNLDFSDVTLEQMDVYWNEAKQQEFSNE